MANRTGERDKPGKLFIGSISFNTDEAKLKSTFRKYGEIADVQIVKDKASGISRGFGFVTYANPPDADDAVSALNGTELDGKFLKVTHALKSRSAESRDRGGRPPMGGRGGFSPRGGGGASRGRGGRDSFDRPSPWSGGSWYDSQKSTTASTASRGRGRGGAPPLLDHGGSRRGGRGGPPRSLLDDEEYGSGRSGRGPLLSTPNESGYRREEDGLYAPRMKAPPPRSARPAPYSRDDDLDARRPAAGGYERKSRFEDLAPPSDRDSRAPTSYGRPAPAYDPMPARDARLTTPSYGRDQDAYGSSLSTERSSRPAPASSYDREPATYRRDAPAYGREEAGFDRLPAERDPAPRHSLLDDPYTARSREPALSDYPASRPAAREYPAVDRPVRAELTRDPYARDPYAPAAREPAVARDYDRARDPPPAAPRERDAYSRPSYPAAAPREPAGRAGLPPARALDAGGDYDRPVARDQYPPAERNGTYPREREALDPYASAGAGASRYDSYPPARDTYAAAPLAEKPAYGARNDPYGSASAGRSAYSRR